MTHYNEITLTKDANTYLVELLRRGKTFAQVLLNQLDLTNGPVSTLLPSNCDLTVATHFNRGGITNREESLTFLSKQLKNFLQKEDNRLCIFEHALARPNDPFLTKIKRPYFTFDDEVYMYLTSNQASQSEIRETITHAGPDYLFIGAMTSFARQGCSNINSGDLGSSQTYDTLQRWATNTEKVIAGAYDGEGFLIWHRNI